MADYSPEDNMKYVTDVWTCMSGGKDTLENVLVFISEGIIIARLPRRCMQLTIERLVEAKRDMDAVYVPFNKRKVIINPEGLTSLFNSVSANSDSIIPVKELLFGERTDFLGFEFKCEE